MIAFLKGKVTGRGEGHALVDVGGVGYRVFMSSNAIAGLPKDGEPVAIQTHLIVREDDMSLYGFGSPEEKELFELLITVTGVGPRLALSVLSTYLPSDLKEAIAREDVAVISDVPGIGRKTAQRIILDLKDKLGVPDDLAPSKNVTADTAAEAREALLAMGFSKQEVRISLRGYDGPNEAEDLIVHALRKLGGTP